MLKKGSLKSTDISAKGLRFAIVAARYNPEFTDPLLNHTLKTLAQAKAALIKTVRVPGTYEIPVATMSLAKSKKFHAIIALGVVFSGKTSHAEHITFATAINLQKIAIQTGIPVIYQVLTPKNVRDARQRALSRGAEAAHTAIEMARTMGKIS